MEREHGIIYSCLDNEKARVEAEEPDLLRYERLIKVKDTLRLNQLREYLADLKNEKPRV